MKLLKKYFFICISIINITMFFSACSEGVMGQYTEDTDFVYTVTFDSRRVAAEPDLISKTIISPSRTVDILPEPQQNPGYTFAGWFTEINGRGTQFTETTEVTADITVYAYWSTNPVYTVTYDSDGGSAVGPQHVTLPATTVVTLESPSKQGYIFAGWYTEKNGGGTEFTSSTTVTANITVFAKWSSFPVIYKSNGGTGPTPIDSNNYSIGDYVTVQTHSERLIRTGHTFIGWNTSIDGKGTNYHDGEIFKLNTASITLYANWLPDKCIVTFNSMGGSSVAAQTVNYGSIVTTPAIDAKGGFDFIGWYKDASCTQGWNFVSEPVTGNITLYAKWSYKNYALRDTGPAGGLIFYINPNFETDGWKYMEAAPYDQSSGIKWYNGENITTGAISKAIGTGRSNTTIIVNSQGVGNYAAKICDDLIINGYHDWFLPSVDELKNMYMNLYIYSLGNFPGYHYWSSSELSGDASSAWSMSFIKGVISFSSKNNDNTYVRAARMF